jgi:peptide/nickel transport system substrate-binding protein
MSENDGVDGARSLTRREVLAGAVAGAVALHGGAAALAAKKPPPAPKPNRGGNLRIGMSTDPASGNLNAWTPSGLVQIARNQNVYEKLADFDSTGAVVPQLALSWEPNKTVDQWQVKLRPGVMWHNGKPFTADDVIYSYQQILNPSTAANAFGVFNGVVDPNGMKKVNDTTIIFNLLRPYALFQNIISINTAPILQNGWNNFGATVIVPGTGPFELVSYQPGIQTTMSRNPGYWQAGKPYVDSVDLVLIGDSTARLNALLAGQVDAIESVDPTTTSSITGNPGFKLLVTKTGHWTPMAMACGRPPFTDYRVRQAFRLMVDRPAMVKQALNGYGFVGNDLAFPFDQYYDHSLPQRVQDIDKAKFLLKKAGQENLTVTLNTSTAATGMLETALLFAQQAKAAGVTVNVAQSPASSYFGAQSPFMTTPFFYDDYGQKTMDQGFGVSFVSSGKFNDTQWNRPVFDKLVATAEATADPAKAKQFWFALQKSLYDQGGFIIPCFTSFIDGYSAKLSGLAPNPIRALGWYGFKNVWFNS